MVDVKYEIPVVMDISEKDNVTRHIYSRHGRERDDNITCYADRQKVYEG